MPFNSFFYNGIRAHVQKQMFEEIKPEFKGQPINDALVKRIRYRAQALAMRYLNDIGFDPKEVDVCLRPNPKFPCIIDIGLKLKTDPEDFAFTQDTYEVPEIRPGLEAQAKSVRWFEDVEELIRMALDEYQKIRSRILRHVPEVEEYFDNIMEIAFRANELPVYKGMVHAHDIEGGELTYGFNPALKRIFFRKPFWEHGKGAQFLGHHHTNWGHVDFWDRGVGAKPRVMVRYGDLPEEYRLGLEDPLSSAVQKDDETKELMRRYGYALWVRDEAPKGIKETMLRMLREICFGPDRGSSYKIEISVLCRGMVKCAECDEGWTKPGVNCFHCGAEHTDFFI